MKKGKMVGSKRIGKEVRKVVSIRLEPRIKKKLRSKYGSIQAWIDACISKENL